MVKSPRTNRTRPAVNVLDDAEKIGLVVDFERSEILRLLDRSPMTETQLSEKFGLTKASIGYHLNLLMEGGLIEIVRTEVEEHGIMQKYYASKAAVFIPDFDRAPEQVGKKLICSMKEWLRGVLSAFRLHGPRNKSVLRIDSDIMEELAKDALRKMTAIGRKYEKEITSEEREFILSRIHERMLADLIRGTRWSEFFNPIFKTGSFGMKKIN